MIDALLLVMQLSFCNAASRERIVVMTCVVEIRRVVGRPNRLFACHGQCAWQDVQSRNDGAGNCLRDGLSETSVCHQRAESALREARMPIVVAESAEITEDPPGSLASKLCLVSKLQTMSSDYYLQSRQQLFCLLLFHNSQNHVGLLRRMNAIKSLFKEVGGHAWLCAQSTNISSASRQTRIDIGTGRHQGCHHALSQS